MGEIVNLSRVRRQRAQALRAAEAAENRVRHGRTKPETQRDTRLREAREKLLDGVRRPGPDDEPAGA